VSQVSLLTARGVSVSYGALLVLHDATLSVAAGDRTAVVGPNGVGKSTLLRALAGELTPAAGTITAAGNVGYLPQERDRQGEETAMAYLSRRTGVAAAERACSKPQTPWPAARAVLANTGPTRTTRKPLTATWP